MLYLIFSLVSHTCSHHLSLTSQVEEVEGGAGGEGEGLEDLVTWTGLVWRTCPHTVLCKKKRHCPHTPPPPFGKSDMWVVGCILPYSICVTWCVSFLFFLSILKKREEKRKKRKSTGSMAFV